MKILVYNLPFLEVKGTFVNTFDELYEKIDKDFDVLILNFLDISDLIEIRNMFKGIVIFLCNYVDEITYKKALEYGDYCYGFYELFKLYYRLKYLEKKLKKRKFFKYKNLFFDLQSEKLFKDREEINLTCGEKEILKILIQNKDRFLDKYKILEMSDYIDNEDSVKVLISRLRKLGFEIESLKNQGYRIKEEK
jgi:DNA-binding response OmpR family regulator